MTPLIQAAPKPPVYTPAQEKAIRAKADTIVAVAGPGSGKTRILVEHFLLHREESDLPTVIVTFTNAGAEEIRERLEKGGHPLPWHLGTLHSYCLRILAMHGQPFILLDEAEAKALRETALADLRSKVSLLALGRELTSPGTEAYPVRMAAYAYRAKLKEDGAEDYDTLLLSMLEFLDRHKINLAALYVDEFQDSAHTDALIYEALTAGRKFYVGDPDQAIYGFRGGKLENLLRLVDKPGTYCVSLEDNFRCSTRVALYASSFIASNRLRYGKATISRTGEEGYFQAVEVEDELAAIRNAVERLPAQETLAILTRFNADRIRITDFLASSGFIRKEAAEKELPRDWTLTLAALTLATRPESEGYAYRFIQARDGTKRAQEERDHAKLNRKPLRVANIPETVQELWLKLNLSHVSRELIWKGLGALRLTAEARLTECATPLLLWLRTAGKEYEGGVVDKEQISVMTVHASKGREFDHVVITGVDSKSYGTKPEKMEEDRRLLYVGITRARFSATVLTCSTAKNPYTGFQEKRSPSPLFLELLS